jgi:protein involved in polysaccharide export with SLBB domain
MTTAPNPPRPAGRTTASRLFAALLVAVVTSAAAQTDLMNTGPRGLTDTTLPAPAGASAPASAPAAVNLALPPNPATAASPLVFGTQMFTGRFGGVTFSGFNADYVVATGDRVSVRMWGAFTFDATQPVDVQGNIFLPNIGPVAVRGVRNADLNRQVEAQVKRTFRANVGVYATLDAAQPVKIYVTGFVRAPGLYAGLSSDSILYYLDRAGGIDPDRGSFLDVEVLRGGKRRALVNLYRFLLQGQIEPLQLQDGDAVVALPRQHTVQISGEVVNPYVFEFARPLVPATELLAIARPKPDATHMSIVRQVGATSRSEYYALGDVTGVSIQDGDQVTVTSDKYPGTILVRIEGAHLGERTLVLPYGAQLKDAIARVRPAPQARLDAVQLYRLSVATRQKDLLATSLRSLETYALTSRSATSEESALRGSEAQRILNFIDRARQAQPRGQVILANGPQGGVTGLEDGDIIRVPEQSNLVQVSGEVLLPNAIVWEPNAHVSDFIARAGGFTQGADEGRLLLLRQDGSVAQSLSALVQPGDEIMVLPKIEAKSVEITRSITQIIYQLAISAKVLFGL